MNIGKALGGIASSGGLGLAGILGSGGGLDDIAGSGMLGLAGLLMAKKKPKVPPLITGIAGQAGANNPMLGGLASILGGGNG